MKNALLYLGLLYSPLQSYAQNTYFPPVGGTDWDTLSSKALGWCPYKIDSLYSFLEAQHSKAFILVKDGKIVLEKYFNTATATDALPWASAGKTLTALMVGIAQQEGSLSITSPSSTYLGSGWTSCTSTQEGKITIWHQLTMTTGLDDAVPDHYCTLDTCLQYKADAGQRWAYHNGPYTLLDQVIEAATGQKLNSYMNLKIKKITGMTGSFIPVGYNNVYFSTPRSMARFGLLILNKGFWDGTPVLGDSVYFNQMIHTSQELNKAYGYLWWLNGKQSYRLPQLPIELNGSICPHAPPDMIAAMGKNGQFLNIVPSQNLLWIRMGDAPNGDDVPFSLNDQIWKYVGALDCDVVGIQERIPTNQKLDMEVYATPNFMIVSSSSKIQHVSVYTLQGQVVGTVGGSGSEMIIPLSNSKLGTYIVQAQFVDGSSVIKRVFVE
ncbi:MAG TPA: serine hydrolase [Cytophagales bacterium]|nr:serine hydrolase [Cytophagales bacterium]